MSLIPILIRRVEPCSFPVEAGKQSSIGDIGLPFGLLCLLFCLIDQGIVIVELAHDPIKTEQEHDPEEVCRSAYGFPDPNPVARPKQANPVKIPEGAMPPPV